MGDEFELGELKIEDTNLAGVGSDEDKAVRKAAAETEPAWKGCGMVPGIEIWRVEAFKVVPWPKEEYGNFYEGDSYIVLQTVQGLTDDTLRRDIYFWLGLKSSIDEQGTAAYKTVELDDLFDGTCVQHREVQKYESSDFKSLFKSIKYLKGGVASGFKQVGPDGGYAPRLLISKRLEGVVHISQVATSCESLNQGDAFILDAGTKIYTWFGSQSSPFEKQAANTYAENLENERSGKSKVTDDLDDEFWNALGGQGEIKSAAEVPALPERPPVGEGVLLRVSDDTGELKCENIAQGDLTKGMLTSDSVYICDSGCYMMIWIGSGVSDLERRSALNTATKYLRFSSKPLTTPVCIVQEGQALRPPFDKIFAS